MFRRVFGGVFGAALLFVWLGGGAAFAQGVGAPVVVVGGTPAGVAAAVAAARQGADVVLVSGRPELGGVLTDAMMDQWDLNVAPDGAAIQGGLFREIHAALGDAFTPDDAGRVFLQLVMGEPRIRLITHARVVAVHAVSGPDGRVVDSVSFARRSGGVFQVDASAVVDATDNGDVAAMAGARFDVGRQDTGVDMKMQPVTLMFTLRGLDWGRVVADYDVARYGPGGASERRAWGYAKLLRAYRPLSNDAVVRDLNLGRESDGEVTVNAVDVLNVDGRSDAELARARAIGVAEAERLVAFLRERLPGFEQVEIGRFASAIYVRETRHFAGVERLTADAVWDGSIPHDTIGLSSYPLDLHPVTANDRLAYAPVRHVYGIPFGALVPRDLANVILASPAISATHVAAGSARVIPTTIEEGEAAGIAAALARHTHQAFTAMVNDSEAVETLQDTLRSSGAILSYGGADARPSAATSRGR